MGNEPYVFVSYSHQDEAIVYNEIRWLQDQGVKIWYDTQIQAGSEWSEALANAIAGCTRFLFCITPNSVASENCRRELNFAQAEGRQILAVHLEPTEVPPGLRLSLDNRQGILKYRFSDNDYHARVLNALTTGQSEASLPPTRSQPVPTRRMGIVLAAAALVAAIMLGTIVLREMSESPDAIVSTHDPTQDRFPAADDSQVTVGPNPLEGPGGTSNLQARAHYLVAGEIRGEPERALKELESAVAIDPEFSNAWIDMSYTYGEISRDPEKFAMALDGMGMAATRAVASAPDYWNAHVALWVYLTTRRDFVGADRAFNRGMALANAQGISPLIYQAYLLQFGRHTKRIAHIKSVQHIDPMAPAHLAQSFYFLGRRDEALREIERLSADRRKSFDEYFAIERGDVQALDELLFAGTDLEGLWGTDGFLAVLRQAASSDVQYPRGLLSKFAIYAAQHDDIELALALLRKEYLRDAYGGAWMIWHPLLTDVRANEGFKTFLRDFGIVAMFQASGEWNDYCQPVGDDDFECR